MDLGDIREQAKAALAELGVSLEEIEAVEPEPGLGNGGLGRLAACYMESMTTEEVPAIGYGIRYEFGLFKQEIRDGWQVEKTDKWLQLGTPWEIARPERNYLVGFGGHTEQYHDEHGNFRVRWVPANMVKGVAHDIPIGGYNTEVTNFLRLWVSHAVESFDLQAFNKGDYYDAVQEKMASETISKVLYPNDEPEAGKRLRLAQQYFFTSCSLQDMIRIQRAAQPSTRSSSTKDLRFSLTTRIPRSRIAELMRLLVDEHQMAWEQAWDITRKTLGYTNHTLLPEALEKWPLPLFASVLPRHLEIIYEINRRFLDEVTPQVGRRQRAHRPAIADR